ncbi:MAG: hypothetical protein J2P31_06740 [Blastocatellia bacterium]|nr:hypothetical protein [Blastocatellia bacterium]
MRNLPSSGAYLEIMGSTRKGGIQMKFDDLKKVVVTLALAITFLVGLGIGDNAKAQGRRDYQRLENQSLERTERLNRERANSVRLPGPARARENIKVTRGLQREQKLRMGYERQRRADQERQRAIRNAETTNAHTIWH